MNWKHTVRGIKDLITRNNDYESIQKSMEAMAEVLEKEPCFRGFDTTMFHMIPDDDDNALDYADRLLDKMYDWADAHTIWID